MKRLKYIVLPLLAFSFYTCDNDELDELRNRDNDDTGSS